MSDDLVGRLRHPAMASGGLHDGMCIAEMQQAADEIERLRAQLASAKKVLKEIAEHPENKTFTCIDQSSYGVGWAFWNVQQIARMALTAAPSSDAKTAKVCGCGMMCQDLGKDAGCRYLRPERATLRKLVDIVYQHATESQTFPATVTADLLIDRAFALPDEATK